LKVFEPNHSDPRLGDAGPTSSPCTELWMLLGIRPLYE
jgi:hypothetical protein